MTSVTKIIATNILAALVFLQIMVMFLNKSFTKEYYIKFMKDKKYKQWHILTQWSTVPLGKLTTTI
jgi:hypothetical protein